MKSDNVINFAEFVSKRNLTTPDEPEANYVEISNFPELLSTFNTYSAYQAITEVLVRLNIGTELDRQLGKNQAKEKQKLLEEKYTAAGLTTSWDKIEMRVQDLSKGLAIRFLSSLDVDRPFFQKTANTDSIADEFANFLQIQSTYANSADTNRERLKSFLENSSRKEFMTFANFLMSTEIRHGVLLYQEKFEIPDVYNRVTKFVETSTRNLGNHDLINLGIILKDVVNCCESDQEKLNVYRAIISGLTDLQDQFTDIQETNLYKTYHSILTEIEEPRSILKYDVEKINFDDEDRLVYRTRDDHRDFFQEKYIIDDYAVRRLESRLSTVIESEVVQAWKSTKHYNLLTKLREQLAKTFGHQNFQIKDEVNSFEYVGTLSNPSVRTSFSLNASRTEEDRFNGDFTLNIHFEPNFYKVASRHAGYVHNIEIKSFNEDKIQDALAKYYQTYTTNFHETGLNTEKIQTFIRNNFPDEKDREYADRIRNNIAKAIEHGVLPASLKTTIRSRGSYGYYTLTISGLPEGMPIRGFGYQQYIKDNPRFSSWDNDESSPLNYSPAFFELRRAIEDIATMGHYCTDDGDHGSYPVLHNFNVDLSIHNKLENIDEEFNIKNFEREHNTDGWAFKNSDFIDSSQSGLDTQILKVETGKKIKTSDLRKLDENIKTILNKAIESDTDVEKIQENLIFLSETYRDLLKIESFGLPSSDEAKDIFGSLKSSIQLRIIESAKYKQLNFVFSQLKEAGLLGDVSPSEFNSSAAVHLNTDRPVFYDIEVQNISPSTGLPISVIHKAFIKLNNENHNIWQKATEATCKPNIQGLLKISNLDINLAAALNVAGYYMRETLDFYVENKGEVESILESFTGYRKDCDKDENIINLEKYLATGIVSKPQYIASKLAYLKDEKTPELSLNLVSKNDSKYIVVTVSNDKTLIVNNSGEMVAADKSTLQLLGIKSDTKISVDAEVQTLSSLDVELSDEQARATESSEFSGSTFYSFKNNILNGSVLAEREGAYYLIDRIGNKNEILNENQISRLKEIIKVAGQEFTIASPSFVMH